MPTETRLKTGLHNTSEIGRLKKVMLHRPGNMWAMERFLGGKLWGLGLNMLLGLLVCYAFGTAWFMVVYPMGGEGVGLWTALTWCVFPYVPFDLIKIALALTLTSQLRKPRMYPPVWPSRMPIPPEKLANTGAPTAPRST